MSISKLPSGRWRSQCYDSATGKNVAVADVIGGPRSFKTKREAKKAREEARTELAKRTRHGVTVAMFRERWLTDKLFATPKESTRLHYAERTKRFTERYGDMNIGDVNDETVTAWLRDGNASTVPAIRAMFNDAMTTQAGRLVQRNPFNKLGLAKTKGNAEVDPPSEETVWDLIEAARALSGPYWAAWLQVAAFTGLRPGENDAIRWADVDFDRGRVKVTRQFNVKTSTFTLPKNGRKREALLTPQAREALEQLPRAGEFCTVNSKGEHWTHHARLYHWNKVRKHTGFTDDLYVATRHFAGWFMVNELLLPSEDVAIVLGHEDGGELVRRLYGHRSRELALDRAMSAFTSRQTAQQTAHATLGLAS